VTNIFTPVKWFDCQNFLLSNGVERFVFLGPGKALANMSRKEVERGVWKGDERGEKLEIETVATLDDLERVRELILPNEKQSRKNGVEAQVAI
jgi:malonyl CoA-acyl carrier protein transacylase